jgi:ferredoxin
MLRFLRRTPAAPELPPGAATEAAHGAGKHTDAGDGLLTIVGGGAEPVRGDPLPIDGERLTLLAGSWVESVEGRCVQCGICSYNCPVGIDVRSYSRRALPVLESHCILCGECVARCPRGVLSFHRPDAA